MNNHFKRITSNEGLDELMVLSNKEPVAVFKHSTACPVSSNAYRELEKFPGEVALIEVQGARAVSTEIGARTGVPHESPQVIVLRNGKAVWHASHWQVTSNALEQAMREHV